MMAAIATIWTVVLILPSMDGRNPRKPVTMLMAAAPTRIKTSRLITATVTQNGTGRCDGTGCGKTARIDSTTNDVTSISLSAIGSRIVPSCDFWLKRRASTPSSPSGMPGGMENPRARKKRWEKNRGTNTGIKTIRKTVRRFGTVTMREDIKVQDLQDDPVHFLVPARRSQEDIHSESVSRPFPNRD